MNGDCPPSIGGLFLQDFIYVIMTMSLTPHLTRNILQSKVEMLCFSLWIYNKGDTHINDQTVYDGPDVAFGGKKMRGMGRFGNPWVVEGFTVIKWISKQNIARQYPF